jgi:hypothetical protein
MPLKTSDEKQDLILKVFDYFEAESKLSLGESEMNICFFLLCLNNIHKTCFHFLKVYTKHGLFTWYIWSIHIGLLYQRELVCLLLPTSSVNNNNSTCDFIYISLSCDYLI